MPSRRERVRRRELVLPLGGVQPAVTGLLGRQRRAAAERAGGERRQRQHGEHGGRVLRGDSEESPPSEPAADAPAPPPSPQPVAAQAPARPPASREAQAALGNTVAHGATTPATTTARGPAGRTTPAPGGAANNVTAAAVSEATPPAPMLIYTAAVDISVRRAEITATLDRVVDLAYSMGGYLVQRTDSQVQVRVPSARFREGVRRVEELAEVLHRTINAQDVSEEFNDLEVRLTNLRAVRRRLEEFLARAANVAEALRVAQELERVTQEMDRIEGRMRFLRARATFSLVTVTAHARSEVVVAPDPLPGSAVRRPLDLPVVWLERLGLGLLLQLR
ncbi:MAG: DUF4349 domain-containing protein [Deltaproteobacteria bacterium]|nr:DUF4349 domain-containing protein [Deltaproteobacteria bacterium]